MRIAINLGPHDDWPTILAAAKLGVSRTFLTFWHPFDKIAAVKSLYP